jgi:ATP-dependent Lhr-like helicase
MDANLRRDRKLASALPTTWSAFFSGFGRLTEVQRTVIPAILTGQDVLVTAATASGKTEAACAPLVERLNRRHDAWTILYVSPTRALVNDLYERLYPPLNRMGLRLDRRTGEYRSQTSRAPNVLLTTPESFDSLLCRGRRRDPDGHDLASVVAVVLDEIHLLLGTARGEQVRWLIERLRRLRLSAEGKGWTKDDGLQIVGLSATLPNPSVVLEAFLPGGTILHVSGGREIETVTAPSKSALVEHALPAYLASPDQPAKVLVFSNARKRVDMLTAALRPTLKELGYEIRAHHGSLDKAIREDAEKEAKTAPQIVVVATSTLEFGIDIGDIDLVVLDGPPPDVPSLLQRIGRGNRRSQMTRVMACADGTLESLVQAALIDASRAGWLGVGEHGPHHAVACQQIASYIFQSPTMSRKSRTVQSLLDACAAPIVARGLLAAMLESGELRLDGDNLRLGEAWLDKTRRGEIHSNIEGGGGATVMDEATGQTIAVGVRGQTGRGLQTGGRLLEVRKWSDFRIEVRQTNDTERSSGDWQYSTRPRIEGSGHPVAVRRYLGFDPDIWPCIEGDDATYCFHFGGARRKAVIDLAFEAQHPKGDKVTCNAWLVKLPTGGIEKPGWMSWAHAATLDAAIQARIDKLERILGRPDANKRLPMSARLDEVRGWLHLDDEVSRLRMARLVPVAEVEVLRILRAIAGTVP